MKKLRFRLLAALPFLGLCLCTPTSRGGTNSVINMSHYDEMTPNFAKMVNEGCVGAIHEATFPLRQADMKYRARQADALRAGLLWGAYHFADGTDPIRQADHFLDTVESHWPSSVKSSESPGVLLVLDFEQNHYAGGTMRVDQAVEFVERVRKKTGRYPGLYASENRIKEIINGPNVSAAAKQTLTNCWLWIANYHYVPKVHAPWNQWTLWQYTGDGTCDLPRSLYPIGIANIAKAERNIFNGSKAAVKAFWKKYAWNPAD